MDLIAQGAEAKLYRDGEAVIKERVRKGYRHPKIDEALRAQRTRREAKVLERLPVPGPSLIGHDRAGRITMSYLEGDALVTILDGHIALAEEVGRKAAQLHDAGIIHGDLTTSNMLLHDGKVHFIDFGLSFFSERIEDKAVDVHLFRQALESKHYRIAKKAYDAFLAGYQPADREQVLARLEQVERRGRYKGR